MAKKKPVRKKPAAKKKVAPKKKTKKVLAKKKSPKRRTPRRAATIVMMDFAPPIALIDPLPPPFPVEVLDPVNEAAESEEESDD